MSALESAERAARTLLEFPLVFVGAAALGVLKLPVEAFRPLRITYDVYAVLALLTFVFTPVLLCGLYGLAASALGGTSSTDVYWTRIGDGYQNLVLANVLYALVQHLVLLLFFLAAVLVFVTVAGGVEILADTASDPSSAQQAVTASGYVALGGLVLVSLSYLAVRFTIAFFMQLYKPSAAIGENGPIDAFRESATLVRSNLESTLSFVLVRGFVMIVLVLPGVVALVVLLVVERNLLDQFQTATAGIVTAAVLVVVFAVGVVELAFLATHRVAFYRSLTED